MKLKLRPVALPPRGEDRGEGAISRITMRRRKIFAGAIVVCIVGLLTALLWPDRTRIVPPSVSLVKIESAGLTDDEGTELWWVTLSIRNTNNVPFDPENSRYVKSCLYVEDDARPMEVLVANRWMPIKGGLGCYMSPGVEHTTSFIMPAGVNSCRASLKYTNQEIRNHKWLARVAMRLPRLLQSRLSNRFWQWANYPQYRQSLHWQEIKIEVPFPTQASPLPKFGE